MPPTVGLAFATRNRYEPGGSEPVAIDDQQVLSGATASKGDLDLGFSGARRIQLVTMVKFEGE
jgi:hypothetical protein